MSELGDERALWIGLPGSCGVFFIGAMWLRNEAGIFWRFEAGYNRNKGSILTAVGLHARYVYDPVEVTGRFGRRHPSPRYRVSWSQVFNWSNPGSASSGRDGTTISKAFPPPWDDDVVIIARVAGPTTPFVPISPVFRVSALPTYSVSPAWSWQTGCVGALPPA